MSEERIHQAADILAFVLRLAVRIAEAIGSGEARRVDEVLPNHLRITLQKLAAEEAARAKFGPRESRG